MDFKGISLLFFNVIFALNIESSKQCPQEKAHKGTERGSEIADQTMPITIEKVKARLKESGVFDSDNPDLTDRERKELSKLFEAVEIMMTSRARQPASIQSIFASLRMVERAVKKQLKEGQISETLAFKFNWDKMWRIQYDGALSLSLTDQIIKNHPKKHGNNTGIGGTRKRKTIIYLDFTPYLYTVVRMIR